MSFRIATVHNDNSSTEVYFVGLESWGDYDLILGLLQKENNCQIISDQEAIYIRKADLLWNGIKFQLVQDDMLGNFLFTPDNKVVPTLEQLAQNVIDSVMKKLKEKGLL